MRGGHDTQAGRWPLLLIFVHKRFPFLDWLVHAVAKNKPPAVNPIPEQFPLLKRLVDMLPALEKLLENQGGGEPAEPAVPEVPLADSGSDHPVLDALRKLAEDAGKKAAAGALEEFHKVLAERTKTG